MLIVWTMMMVMMVMSHPTQRFFAVIWNELFWLMKWTTVEPPQIWEWHISKQNDDDWEENTITQYQGLVGSLVSFIMLILTNCTECHVWDRTAWNITYTCTQGIHLMLKLYFTSCIKTCAPSPRGVVPWFFVLKITSHWNGLIFNGLFKIIYCWNVHYKLCISPKHYIVTKSKNMFELLVDLDECIWMCMNVCECVWMCMNVYECVWMCMNV